MIRNSSYSRFLNQDKLVAAAETALKGIDFDTMVGQGLSGALVIPILAQALNKHFAIIRKENDSEHTRAVFEGEIGDKWIFVDDFIESGATLRRVKEGVSLAYLRFSGDYWTDKPPQFVGAYLYNYGEFLAPSQIRV